MQKKLRACNTVSFLLASFLSLMWATHYTHAAEPGTAPSDSAAAPDVSASISPFITEFGKVSLSIDGLGTPGTDSIQVDKPDGATVRTAYLAAASTGFTSAQIFDGNVKIDGNDVAWDLVSNLPNSISSFNSLADVTDLVKAKIDAAPVGLIDIEIEELVPANVDGVILAVVFDDPNQSTDNTVVLLFGAQDVEGDNFSVALAEPIDTSDPNLVIDMSLGISYGFQKSSAQFSQVDVNGTRLTTSAGGEDDAYDITSAFNGELITVGGIGDSNENPADPLATAFDDPRIDDELYNLLPFVNSGDTSILVSTLNPSNDDNILFAGFFFGASLAVVGEGILLEPTDSTAPVGESHTVTATVQDDDGNPIVNREVIFEIIAGPQVGITEVATTDDAGQAQFTYIGAAEGEDTIVATMIDSSSTEVSSNEVTQTWTDLLPGKAILISPNGLIEESNPTYVWNAVPTAEQYLLWIVFDDTRERFSQWYTAEEAGCEDGICEINPNPASLPEVAASLYGDQSYTWWVLTWNSAGVGPWSDPMNYLIAQEGLPGETVPVAPIGTTEDSMPEYEWIAAPVTTWYKIQAWEVGAPGYTVNQWFRDIDILCTSISCSVKPEIIHAPGSYRWRIRGWNNAGLGPWSNIQSFDVGDIEPE